MPVLCGSALKNKGVQLLLDAVVDYLPSPLDVPPVVGHRPRDRRASSCAAVEPSEPFAALAFKIVADPYVGKLAYIRVYSGALEAGLATSTTRPRASASASAGCCRCTPTTARTSTSVAAGDIAAVVGLKSTVTGDTLCDPDNPVVLESIKFPEPVIDIAIEPKTKADQDKMGAGACAPGEEDPTFRVRYGPGDRPDDHLGHGRASPRSHRRPHAARVPGRRERRPAAGGLPRDDHPCRRKAEGRFVRQSGGRGLYGARLLEVEPLERGGGFVFENKTVGGSVPREYVPADRGRRQRGAETGVAGRLPDGGHQGPLVDGSYHEVDSSEMAFKIAGSMAAARQRAQAGARRCWSRS